MTEEADEVDVVALVLTCLVVAAGSH
jgi:hypothetical protein